MIFQVFGTLLLIVDYWIPPKFITAIGFRDECDFSFLVYRVCMQ